MLCRAVLTAVAISYLICVLWLSGMQREDLDVNMLRKLEKHNVNIDDMSRESLKQQCLELPINKDNAPKKGTKDITNNEENKTSTEHAKLDSERHIKKLLKNDLKNILNNFIDTKAITATGDKTLDDTTVKIKNVTSKIITISPKPVNNNHNDELKELPVYGRELTDKLLSMKYGNDQPNIESIVKFWQLFASSTTSYKSRRKEEEPPEQKPIKTNPNKNRSKEKDYINTLIADFINKNIEVTTEKPTTTASVDLRKISDQIDKLLKLYPQVNTTVPFGTRNTLKDNDGDDNIEIIQAKRDFNSKPKKITISEGFDNFANNKNDFSKHKSPVQSSKNMDYFPDRIQEHDSNYKQNEREKSYRSLEDNKMDNSPSRLVEGNDAQIMQRYPTLDENNRENTFQKTIPTQDSIEMLLSYETKHKNKIKHRIPEHALENRETEMVQSYRATDGSKITYNQNNNLKDLDMELLQGYKTKDRQEIKKMQNKIPDRAFDDKETEMSQNYQTIERGNINPYPNNIAQNDDMEMMQRYRTIPENNKKSIFSNRIPVRGSNEKYMDNPQKIQIKDRNKITARSNWMPVHKSHKNLEKLQIRTEENNMANFPNNVAQYTPESQSKTFENSQVLIGGNKMISSTKPLSIRALDDKQIVMQQRYQSAEETKMETFTKINSAQVLDNMPRDARQRYRSAARNEMAGYPNELPVPASERHQREMLKRYQTIERNKMPSYLIEVPLQAPDSKQWATFQKHQSLYMPNQAPTLDPTLVPKTEITKATNVDTIKREGTMITKDCIKEIAENVKAIVLKDLRKEITTTPVTTSPVTTTTVTLTTCPNKDEKKKTTTDPPLKRQTRENPPQNKTIEATQVMAKFMELFEQFKDIKEKTEQAIIKNNVPNNLSNQNNAPLNANQVGPVVGRDPYRVKRPPEDAPGSPFALQMPGLINKNAIKNVNFMQMSPMVLNGMPLTPQSFIRQQSKPITIQTNSDEVQPLGIPLNKPIKLIHQNIIVTTTHPETISQGHKRDKWVEKYEHKDGVNRKEKYKHVLMPAAFADVETTKDLIKKPYKSYTLDDPDRSIKEKKSFNPNRYDKLREFKQKFEDERDSGHTISYHGRQGEFKTLKYDRQPYKSEFKDFENLYKSKYNREPDIKSKYKRPYDSSRYSNQDNKKHSTDGTGILNVESTDDVKGIGSEYKHHGDRSYGVILSNNRNRERFHEKLERADDLDNNESAKMDTVASRHQQPLNMKDPRFDDTHFTNFLKTQQKVNEMLEKILSAKTIPLMSGPRSVETT